MSSSANPIISQGRYTFEIHQGECQIDEEWNGCLAVVLVDCDGATCLAHEPAWPNQVAETISGMIKTYGLPCCIEVLDCV